MMVPGELTTIGSNRIWRRRVAEGIAMRRKSITLPSSEDEFLGSVLHGLRRRSKAIKNKYWDWSVDRIFEEYEDERVEKLEIRIEHQYRSNNLCVSIYQDRWIEVSRWEVIDGCREDWRQSGRLVHDKEGAALAPLIEESMDTSSTIESCKVIWGRAIASGPRSID